MCQLWFSKKTVGNIFCTFFRADGVLGAAIAGAGMVVVGGTVLALAGAAALVGMVVKKKWGDATQDISHLHWSTWPPTRQLCLVVYIHSCISTLSSTISDINRFSPSYYPVLSTGYD